MSGLLERIVRRRRASASRRLGPPPASDSAAEANGRTSLNGAPDAASALRSLNAAAERRIGEQPVTAAEPEADHELGLLERSRIRRRARYLRRLREVQLRDLGGFVVELQRFGRERPDLVREKTESAAHTDAELRALERALGTRHALRELREPGIGGACPDCGAVHGSEDRFCASCGSPLREDEQAQARDAIDRGQVYPE
jgi:hypothetical protein